MDNQTPRYNQNELMNILLDKTPIIPQKIDENIFEQQIKSYENIKWRINPHLFSSKKLYQLLLSKKKQSYMVRLNRLNWIVAILITTYSIWGSDYYILMMLIIYPFFLTSGILDHWIVVFNSFYFTRFGFFFQFQQSLFCRIIPVLFISLYH